ncbi:MAG TPA: carboxypeptidase regulatory-like domain-containing protein [Blastocatellia bacterium]|nr:carboxypeptidase regulatory-like domain-containing protein [Blastocatellia bacterium]
MINRITNRASGKARRLLSALFIALALTGAALAQNSTLRGKVLDERGDAIPEAEITLSGKDGKERRGKSDILGDFSIPNVPPGIYTLTSSYKGFQTQTITDLKAPYSGVLQVRMAIAAVEVVTDVSANNSAVSTEPDQNMNAITLSEQEIANLPDNEDDLRDFLNAMAGGGVNGEGANILVDGFSGGRLPPREAISRIVFSQNIYSAEYSNPGFGRVEIISKPGYGDWRGSGSFGYRNAALDARNAFAIRKPDLTQQRYDFFMGGPLLKKRLSTSFFANRQDIDGSSPTVVRMLDDNLNDVEIRPNVPSSTVSTFAGGRIDYLINKNNTLNLNYNYRSSEMTNSEFAGNFRSGFGFGFGGGRGFGGGGGAGAGGGINRLAETASNSSNSGHNLRLTETWIVNSKMIHEARFQFQREHRDARAVTPGLVAINVADSFSSGSCVNCPSLSDSDSVEYQDYLTVTLKKHTIKGGVQLEFEKFYDLSGGNFNGTYSFSSLDQYRAARLALIDPTARQCDPTAPFNPNDPLNPCATQFTINRGDTELKYNMFRGSWFIMDDFRMSPGLTLSYGVRHEFQTHLVDKLNFAPRAGAAWTPFKNRKTVIRAGVGIFYDRLSGGNYANTLRFNGDTQQSFTIRNAIFDPDNPPTGGLQASSRGRTTRILDPSLKAPYSLNVSVTVEQQLPKALVGTITYFQDRGIHQFRTRNINAPLEDPNNPGAIIFPFGQPAGFIYQTESSARSLTNRLDFGLQRRLARFTIFGRYSLGWMNSDSGGIPANNYDLSSEWGRANGDRRHSGFITTFVNLPKGFRLQTMLNASTGAPFNITTGFDNNGDGSINDRPIGSVGGADLILGRNANLTPDFYILPMFDRMICAPGTSTKLVGGLVKCATTAGVLSDQVTLRDFLVRAYPNGVIAQGPGNFNITSSISKTFGFGRREGSGQQAQADRNGESGGGRGGRGGRAGGGGGGRGPGGGRGGRGPGGGSGGPFGGPGMVMIGGPGGFGGGGEGARYNVTFTFSVTNLLNRVNYSQYSGTLGTPFFGLSNSSAAARQMEFNVRFSF